MCAVNGRRFIALNKIESSDLRQCPRDQYLINKAYLSCVTVRNIYESFTNKMAAKTSWHKYGTKLRHSHPMYINTLTYLLTSPATERSVNLETIVLIEYVRLFTCYFIHQSASVVRSQTTKQRHFPLELCPKLGT